ncbi:MAG: cell division protein FtsQ/DivIB [Chitinispirillia bacterium]|nr:cell division protein FtsQ/DivIB [Chitinispirillia bacterium]
MSKVKRIGANRKIAIAEQRAKRPRRVKKIGSAGIIAALIAAVLFAVYEHSPAVSSYVSEAVKSTFKSKSELSAEFQIVNGSAQTTLLLKTAVDSLINKSDSLSIKKDAVIKAAAAIPEIERLSVKSGRDKKTVLRITERTPVALVLDGGIKLVDKNGIRFNAAPGQYYDLPLITLGSAGLSDTIKLETFNTIKKTAGNLGGAFFRQISQIDFSDSSSVNLIFKSERTEYTIGSNDIEKRLGHMKALRERLMQDNREPVHADLRYRGLAYLSML